MAIQVVIPRLGWSMDEGTFAQWLKKDGEWVHKGDMLFVLEGEKAAQEIESFDEGVLHIPPGGAKSGDTVLVGQVIGYLLARGEAPPTDSETHDPVGRAAATKPLAGPAARRLARNLGVDLGQVAGSGRGGRITTADIQSAQSSAKQESVEVVVARERIAATPRARRTARQLDVDLNTVRGSGRGGRVRERDVRALAGERSTATGSRVQSIRKTIAARMAASFHSTAPVTLTTRADASNLEVLRKTQKQAQPDNAPTLTDWLIKLTAEALERHPYMNARWQDDNCAAVDQINIGLAVDTELGLLVPVIPDVGRLSIQEISARSRELADRARNGRLPLQQMQAGTFTITNLGTFGIDAFTPIINTPEIAILGVGAMRREAIVLENDHIALRNMITLSLTFDHRAVDGAPAARFLQTLCRLIEGQCS